LKVETTLNIVVAVDVAVVVVVDVVAPHWFVKHEMIWMLLYQRKVSVQGKIAHRWGM